MLSRRLLTLGCAALLFGTGCSKPEPPHLTPKEARVVAVGPQGLEIVLKVEAVNPNKFALSAQSFTAKATLDGKWAMGTVTIAKPFAIPPNVPTPIDVPLTMPWTDVKALTALALAQRPVPYSVDGSAKIGGENLNVDVPFAVTGTITREQIAAAAIKGMPTIPGLTPPP